MEDQKEMPKQGGGPVPPTAPPPPVVPEIPDPEEDDLDDLDDMLDEFAATKIDPPAPAPAAAVSAAAVSPVPAPPAHECVAEVPGGDMDTEFAKRLQSGMADLLSELDTSPEMQEQFEHLVKGIGRGSANPPSASVGAESASAEAATESTLPAGADETFQETIRKTMQRMQDSGQQATAAATSEEGDDMLAEMLKQMQGAGFDGQSGGEEDFSKILLGMMEQLTNKEILYEPMKELNEKYPAWMETHRQTTSAEDLLRYQEQRTLVAEIVTKFEEKSYSDSNPTDREYIVERMQKASPLRRGRDAAPLTQRRCKRLAHLPPISLVI
ncbi:MAG: Peroxisome chaperone and import receptor [Thelocarpon superellum]|nr:MAG: Peroxisome chaperone and import receptor [Thelocarpon superellum]